MFKKRWIACWNACDILRTTRLELSIIAQPHSTVKIFVSECLIWRAFGAIWVLHFVWFIQNQFKYYFLTDPNLTNLCLTVLSYLHVLCICVKAPTLLLYKRWVFQNQPIGLISCTHWDGKLTLNKLYFTLFSVPLLKSKTIKETLLNSKSPESWNHRIYATCDIV